MSKPQNRSVGARISALLVAGALALLLSVPAAGQTEAGWIDPEYGSTSVATLAVPSLARPTCVTTRAAGTLDRYIATITWESPQGMTPEMLYEVRTTNLTANPNTTKSVFQSTNSIIFADPALGGRDFPSQTNLSVQVFVIIPNSINQPTTAVWQSLNPPAAWGLDYAPIDITRASYSCI